MSWTTTASPAPAPRAHRSGRGPAGARSPRAACARPGRRRRARPSRAGRGRRRRVSSPGPNSATTASSPGVPRATTSRAIRSASMTTAPRSARIADTVLLPEATPPVRPTRTVTGPPPRRRSGSRGAYDAGVREHVQDLLGGASSYVVDRARPAHDPLRSGRAGWPAGRWGRASAAPSRAPPGRRPPRSPSAARSAGGRRAPTGRMPSSAERQHPQCTGLRGGDVPLGEGVGVRAPHPPGQRHHQVTGACGSPVHREYLRPRSVATS